MCSVIWSRGVERKMLGYQCEECRCVSFAALEKLADGAACIVQEKYDRDIAGKFFQRKKTF